MTLAQIGRFAPRDQNASVIESSAFLFPNLTGTVIAGCRSFASLHGRATRAHAERTAPARLHFG